MSLLESIRSFNKDIEIRIIPFDDNIEEMTKIASCFNANIVEIDNVWDKIGQNIYADIEYRPGIESWRYFRKLNVFNNKNEEFLFLDANIICLANVELFSRPHGCDFLFYNHSAPGRCFRRPEFELIISNLSPGIKGGYNMAFFMSNSSNVDKYIAEALSKQDNLKKYFGKAPEQAFLAYYIAITNSSHDTLFNHVHDAAFNHTSNQSLELVNNTEYKVISGPSEGRRMYVMKSTGQDMNKKAINYEIIETFYNKALQRLSSSV